MYWQEPYYPPGRFRSEFLLLCAADLFLSIFYVTKVKKRKVNMELKVNNLSFSINQVKIVDDITFRVKEGSFVGLVGPH